MSNSGHFDLAEWRQYVHEVVVGAGIAVDAIAPFGFEVTRDRSYLRRSLTRFFVYIKPHDRSDPAAAELEAVRSILADGAGEGLEHIADVALIVTSRDTVPLGRPQGRSTLYVRSLPAVDGDLLSAYAYYLASVPVLVSSGRLLEIRKYDMSPAARRFVYQLTVACGSIFGSVAELSEADTRGLAGLIRRLPDRDLQTGRSFHFPPSEAELKALERVRELHAVWAAYLTTTRTSDPVKVVDFHSGLSYALDVKLDRVDAAVASIVTAFHEYPIDQSSPPPTGKADLQ